MNVDYANDVQAIVASCPELAHHLRQLVTLEHVFRWLGSANAPDVGEIETVAQDEFSHDMILELRSSGQYLVFGAT